MISVESFRERLKRPRKTRVFKSTQRWEVVCDKKFYCRSSWELRFAKHLQHLKECNVIQDWDYEPETFWFDEIKRGTRSYKPDFKVTETSGAYYWVEVKGYMDAKSVTKIRRFKKYFPNERLVIIDEKWFKKNIAHGKKSKNFQLELAGGFGIPDQRLPDKNARQTA